MLNAEIRPLQESGGTIEEGKCAGCRRDLPNPVNTPRGIAPAPVLLFLDSNDWNGLLLGLCPDCMQSMSYLLGGHR